ncbi:hypothetical protein [Bradyrhizobium retamae]|uniref:Uncharacterized protein n=1 Tax=Bradyrhizobium retamae TaxID=1300035 RepID=A0A0R3N781_9BRAD|nr:hypothetical protein [Bradyrhizobium retamae]KRR28226.1 hypothetical protein CQ13_21430 [Bradyrhizobium retamae]
MVFGASYEWMEMRFQKNDLAFRIATRLDAYYALIVSVIASHPVGAKRRRMTVSAKQSISPLLEIWIVSSLSRLAMTRWF